MSQAAIPTPQEWEYLAAAVNSRMQQLGEEDDLKRYIRELQRRLNVAISILRRRREMKGEPTVVSRARRRDRGPRKERQERVPIVKDTWCSCGSKKDITHRIQSFGKPDVFACSECAERAPFHSHVTRIDNRVYKNVNGKFVQVPIKKKTQENPE